ncbi:MAG: HAMP domain-containing histidine kinase [Chloroflexi bacterium]|nr:HAMP domain-containing histidine kinase [Chloroflexota bacterium]
MIIPRRFWPSTIRARLTLLYTGAFFLAGVMLVALMYLYLARVINHQLTVQGDITHLSTDAHDALMLQFQRAREETFNIVLVASIVSLGVIGVVAGGFGWLLARQALNPLRQITATARRVADRSLHERIALVGPNDEIKELADTLDSMLERLDRSFDNQRRFVANASHELRTPLTINRTLIEVALGDPQANESLRQLGTHLLDVNHRHERLIDGLLILASSEQSIAEPIPVDLAEIVRHISAVSQGAAQNAGIDLGTHLQPAPITGDPVLMERLVQNLLENAIRYNSRERGWVTVTTDVVDEYVHLTVENTGPIVPPYEIPGLFEPFRRLSTTERIADPSNSSMTRGAGLGLSIVRSVAHAHGGDAHASPRTEGGLTVLVRIPLAPTHANS